MIIVKGTIMLTVILLIWFFLVRLHFGANRKAAIDFAWNVATNHIPAWIYVFTVLWIVDIILIVVSVFWFLFLR